MSSIETRKCETYPGCYNGKIPVCKDMFREVITKLGRDGTRESFWAHNWRTRQGCIKCLRNQDCYPPEYSKMVATGCSFGKRKKKKSSHKPRITTLNNPAHLVAKRSTIKGAGMGLFTTKALKKGTTLGQYKGKRLTSRRYNALRNADYVWEIRYKGKNVYIDGKSLKRGNLLRYVNGIKGKKQKRLENTTMFSRKGKVFYKTTKRVPAGKELFIDYGDEYWDDDNGFKFGPLKQRRR